MNKSIVKYMHLEAVKNNIQNTLGKKTPQFIASVASLVNNNSAIAKCEQKTILSACLIAASLDLPINQNLGFAYIIPYKNRNKGIVEAQFQMGWKGFVQLAMRSGQFKTINVTDVKEGEIIENNRLTGKITFEFIEEDRKKIKTVGYVAYMELINGFSKQLYMSMDELKKHGMRYSQMMKRGSGLWKDDFDVMAAKTVIKLLLSKYAPMTIQMQNAQLADQAVIDGEQYNYVDNEPVDATKEGAERETERIINHIKKSKTVIELNECNEALEEQNQDVRELFDNKYKELKEKK